MKTDELARSLGLAADEMARPIDLEAARGAVGRRRAKRRMRRLGVVSAAAVVAAGGLVATAPWEQADQEPVPVASSGTKQVDALDDPPDLTVTVDASDVLAALASVLDSDSRVAGYVVEDLRLSIDLVDGLTPEEHDDFVICTIHGTVDDLEGTAVSDGVPASPTTTVPPIGEPGSASPTPIVAACD